MENDVITFTQELIVTLNKISKMSLQEVREVDVYREIGRAHV